MFLHEVFSQKGYQNIIKGIKNQSDKLDIEYFYDDDKIPDELLGVYISPYWDEMFLVLNGEGKNINELCKRWDKKISTFMIFGSDSKEVINKIKYNVIQIILHENDIVDRSQEGSLNVSRKIFIACTIDENGQVLIDDNEALELPFVLISASESTQKMDVMLDLVSLMPEEGTDMDFIRNPRKRVNKTKGKDGKLAKSFSGEFEQIKEWLTKNDDTEDKNETL